MPFNVEGSHIGISELEASSASLCAVLYGLHLSKSSSKRIPSL